MSPFAIYKITFIHSHLGGRDASQVQRSSSTNSLPSSRTLFNSPLLSPLHTNMFNFFTSQINITLNYHLISLLHLTMFLEILVFTDSNSSPPKYHLLLLLNHFSCVRLCVTPKMAAHQAPPSPGLSRQEHWSGLPFLSPMHESEK